MQRVLMLLLACVAVAVCAPASDAESAPTARVNYETDNIHSRAKRGFFKCLGGFFSPEQDDGDVGIGHNTSYINDHYEYDGPPHDDISRAIPL